jgi:hypothetical protein
MKKISLDEIKSSFSNNIDTSGVAFPYDGKFFRAIQFESVSFFENLLNSPNFQNLIDLGLVETKKSSEYTLENYQLLLQHKTVSTVSYVTEWSGEMLKSAAILTLRLSKELEKNNLQLKDAHPWNVLFEGCQPIFVDFGSIISKKDSVNWFPANEFLGTFVFPIILMSLDCAKEARELLVDKETKRGSRVTKSDIIDLIINKRKYIKVFETLIKINKLKSLVSRNDFDGLINFIEKIIIPLPKTTWSDYCLEEVNMSTFESWIPKRKTVYQIIQECKPKQVLDIGCNTGWFSKLSALNGAKVISFDLDEPSINRLFVNHEAKELGILPLVMNFTKPVEAYGINLRCHASFERYKSQMVFGLAVVHHLVFFHKMTFSEIIEKFSLFSEEYLVIEFIPKDDIHVSKWIKSGYEWYTKENFVKELSIYFKEVNELPSNPDPRVIFLCRK